MKFFGKALAQKREQRRADFYRSLLHYEARIGGEVFGSIPEGVRREFFCLDEHTWVWHEEWTDQNGKHQALTTRYDVRPNGVLKSQGGRSYQALNKSEAQNFLHAVQVYEQRVTSDLRRLMQAA